MKKITIYILGLFISLSAYSQELNNDTILSFAKFTNKGVMLKIAPQRAETWLKGAEKGYQIYRMEIGVDNQFILQNKQPIKPFSEKECEKMPKGEELYQLQKQAIFDNLARSKTHMTLIERIQFSENLQNEFAFYILVASRIRSISASSGLEYIDKTAKSNKDYIYKIKIVNDSIQSHTTLVDINTSRLELVAPELIGIKLDKMAKLEWSFDDRSPIFCYHLEKSSDNINFNRITTAPIYSLSAKTDDNTDFSYSDMLSYTDSLDQNYKDYYYRLVAIDIWGFEHISDASIKVNGVDLEAPKAPKVITYTTDTITKSITYSWNYNKPSDFAGYTFQYSNSLSGPYTKANDYLANPKENIFTLKNIDAGKNYFFRIIVTDTAGNYTYTKPISAHLVDIYPPSIPKAFKAIIDSSGIVHLSWKSNPEWDIKGYKVYAANSKHQRMISPPSFIVSDTFFVDTLNIKTLSKYKYFALSAVDYNFNVSEKTALIKLAIPDVIEPSAGKIKSCEFKDGKIELKWYPSPDKDIAKQNILRRNDGTEKWEVVARVNPETNFYNDEISTGAYEYCVVAIDSAGNNGILSYPYPIEVYAAKKHIEITDFKIKKKNQNAHLSWNTNDKDVKYFIVYREDKDGLRRVASVKINSYIDRNIQKNSSYKYYVVAQDNRGILHKNSKVEKVNF